MMKFAISLLLLALLTGCAQYVAMHAYVPAAPHDKPGNGIIIYVTKAVDNREGVKPKERVSQDSPVGEYRGESPYIFTTHIFYFRSKEKPADIVTASAAGCMDSYGYIVKRAENIDSIPIPDAEAEPVKVLLVSIEKFWYRETYHGSNTASRGIIGLLVLITSPPPYWDVETDAKLRFDIVDRKTRQLLWDHDIAVHDKYRQGRLPTATSREATINDTLVNVMHRFDEAISSDEFKKVIMNAPLTPIQGLPQVK
jgi:hypothetical protein